MTIRIGISGWTYAPWRGVFFPKGLAHRRELEYASRKLSSIEINGTFYSLMRPENYAAWFDATPEDFMFSVKGPRFITHIRRLREPRVPLANFFASGVLRFGRKLGPLLWQLPPSFKYDERRVGEFLEMLPRTTGEAAKLARRHDFRLTGRSWMRPDEDLPLRHALEVRHASFKNAGFLELLRAQGVALVTADTAGKWPYFDAQTADFRYARLHGDEVLYTSGYTPSALREWAGRVSAWSRGGRDVFVYFDNDVKVRAPFDAMSLANLLARNPRPRSGSARFRRTASRSATPSPRIRRRTAAPRRYPAPQPPRPRA
jgi:uncharacterized protein YecE (DUF72 family)